MNPKTLGLVAAFTVAIAVTVGSIGYHKPVVLAPVTAVTPFEEVSPPEAHRTFVEAETYYKKTPPDPDFNLFVDLISASRVKQMQAIIPNYEWDGEKGSGTDSLFLGCVLFQYPTWEDFQKVGFMSISTTADPSHMEGVFGKWLAANKSYEAKYPDIMARIESLPDFAMQCAVDVEALKKANGIINVDVSQHPVIAN